MSEQPEDFTVLIKKLIENPVLMEKMALGNFLFARENFYSSIVIRRLENIFNTVMTAPCAE